MERKDKKLMLVPQQPFLIDGHSDFVNRIRDERRAGRPGALCSEYVPALRAGQVRFAALQTGSDSADETEHEAMAAALEKISYLKSEARECPDITLLRTGQDLDDCLQGNAIGFLLMFEGGRAFSDNPAYVSVYHDLGIRMAALTWNNSNLLAFGSGANQPGRRLTDLGVEVIREMGRLNMILDVSHLADGCVSHALTIASGPVVSSHANARSVCDHDRNHTDEHLRAIAETGGLIGVNFFPRFLNKVVRPSPNDVIAHMNHIINVAGEDAVGLGPDFIDYSLESASAELRRSSVDYGTDFSYPVGLESTKDLYRMPEILARARYSNARIEKILGGNWLRVFRAALS